MNKINERQTQMSKNEQGGQLKTLLVNPQGGELMVDARLLHKQLEVGRMFSHWINARINEFGFEKDKDYLICQNWPIIANQKFRVGGNRRGVDYHLTMDMAKELAMVEKNEHGRQIRQYFIQVEKNARMHYEELKPYRGLEPMLYNQLPYFPYGPAMETFGRSRKSSATKRKSKYPNHFVVLYGRNFISLPYFKMLENMYNAKQLQLDFERGVYQIEGDL